MGWVGRGQAGAGRPIVLPIVLPNALLVALLARGQAAMS
jgi:hypothetical protein